MRLYIPDDNIVIRLSQIYYESAACELRFCSIEGDWYKVDIDDFDYAHSILQDICAKGFYLLYTGLSLSPFYPFLED